MTQLIQQTRNQLSDIKAKMLTETDPDRVYRLAVWGEELNRMLRELLNEPPDIRVCKKCKEEKRIEEFAFVMTTYVTVKKETRVHISRRYTCYNCYNKQTSRAYRTKCKKNDFNYLF